VTSEEFIAAARLEFPELSSVLDDDVGLVHLQVASLRRHTQAAIDGGDRARVETHFEFLRQAWLNGDWEVQNALGVSYLEHLNFQDGKRHRSWAWDLIPEPLKANARDLGVEPQRPGR
jgi:hypothetical protein